VLYELLLSSILMENKNKYLESVKHDFTLNSTVITQKSKTQIYQDNNTIEPSSIYNVDESTNTNISEHEKKKLEDFSCIKNTIHMKINHIINLKYFIQSYINDICFIFNSLDSNVNKTISQIIDKNKYFIRFFKEITTLYETFSLSLLNSNAIINLHIKGKQSDNSSASTIQSSFASISNTIDKAQDAISNSIYDFSKNMQKQIILEGPLSNIKQLYNRVNVISKDTQNLITEIMKKRDKLMNQHAKNEKIFENFKRCYNDNEKLCQLLSNNEVFLIELFYCRSVNKIFAKILNLFKSYNENLSKLRLLVKEFIQMIKDCIDIYITETKKMFLIQEIENLTSNFSTLLETEMNNIKIDDKDILMTTDSDLNKNLNDSLRTFQTNLLRYSFVKNENLYLNENFSVNNSKYQNYEELIEFLEKIFPEKFDIYKSNLILFSTPLKKITGLFSSYKDCLLLVTVQQTILIFDGEINKKNYEMMNVKNIKIKKIDDKKYPFKFEISELRTGMIYNSTYKLTFDAENSERFSSIAEFFEIKENL
jgi:hypothetical protein